MLRQPEAHIFADPYCPPISAMYFSPLFRSSNFFALFCIFVIILDILCTAFLLVSHCCFVFIPMVYSLIIVSILNIERKKDALSLFLPSNHHCALSLCNLNKRTVGNGKEGRNRKSG
jgi:hypothetical protein